jgi:hypothetical protein
MSVKDLNTSFENRITLSVHDLAGDHRSRPHPKHQVFQFLARLQSKGFIAVTPPPCFSASKNPLCSMCTLQWLGFTSSILKWPSPSLSAG